MTDFSQILQREISAKKNKKERKIKKNSRPKKKSKKLKPLESLAVETIIKGNKKTMLSRQVINPVWLSLFEAAKIGGVEKRTIKRAVKNDLIKYKIVDNRYQVEFRSVILFLISRKKLWNKLNENGIGQYVEKWVS